MGTKHLLAVLAEAHHATHLTIHTNQLDGLVASLMEQKQLGRGALIALDDPLQADLLHLGRTAPNTTAPAAEAADANGSSIRMGASTSISASHTSPAAGSSPAAATATKPRGPCYQRLTVDSPVTKASVELVMQLLDLLPGTQHLRELELGQCRMLYGLLCEHKMRTYVAPSLLHTVTQPQPGTSYGTRLGAGSSSSSSSSSSNSSSGPARGWRGSCRALVVDGFGRFGGLRATPLTLLQPLLGCMEQLQVLIGWHVDGTQSLLHTTSLTPLRALVLLETRCCGDMLASLPGLTGLRHLAMTHGDLSWAHVDGAALSALLALTSVDLSYSTTTLPAEVLSGLCSVTGLRSLDLMWTSIASLPEHATALTRLSELHWACSTGPMQLDVVWRLTSLRVLTVGDLRWAAVPGAISQLSNLQSLSVDGLSLASLPTTISALVQLQLLDVGISVIKVLPDTITALTQLKTIQGSGMQAAEQSAAVQAFLAERGVTL
jgi:Leucine-rich repeat (LRR) protein